MLGLVASSDRRLRPVAWLGLAWVLAAWIFARAGVRPYPHYFIATVPPLALLAGAGVSALPGRAAATGPLVAAIVVAGVCLPAGRRRLASVAGDPRRAAVDGARGSGARTGGGRGPRRPSGHGTR